MSKVEDSLSGSSGEGDYFANQLQTKVISDVVSCFVWKFHKALAETNQGNFAYSPLQVSAGVFALLYGATGHTRDELVAVLNTNEKEENLIEDFRILLELECSELGLPGTEITNNNKEDKILHYSAQRLFHAPGDSLREKFIEDVHTYFHIGTQSVDFTCSSGALRKLRLWLESTGLTNIDGGTLKDSAKVDALTRLIFLSTLQFSGSLNMKFQFSRQDCFFYVNGSKRVPVKMLCAETEMTFAVIQKLDARAVAIPYEGNRFSLLIFLPKGKPGISQLEYNLRGYKNATEITDELKSKRKLYFRMPNFKIEKCINLNDVLKSMGASSMFDTNTANFSRLEEYPENVFVSGIIHTVHFEAHAKSISELHLHEGTFDIKSKKCEDSLEFLVEHPFFFMVVANESNKVVVAGRINNPSEP